MPRGIRRLARALLGTAPLVIQPLASPAATLAHLGGVMVQAQEVPAPVSVPGARGRALVTVDTDTGTLSWHIEWDSVSGAPTGLHFHGPAGPGAIAGIVVDVGAISGLASPSVGTTVLTGPQVDEVLSGSWYVNLHTDTNSSGEIRAQVLPTVPKSIPYQGLISDPDGNPLDGDHEITFRLFDAAGTLHWSETRTVTAEGGRFTAALGTLTPLALDFSTSYFLEIQVESDPPMTPRLPLASAPYALRAGSADEDADTLASLGCTAGQHAAWGGVEWICTDDGDADPSNELIDSASLDAAQLEIVENGITHSVDLGPLQYSDGYPENPRMLFGRVNACYPIDVSGSEFGGFIEFQKNFDAPPVFVASIDESLNDSGSAWTRLRRRQSSRAGIQCAATADAVHWMAMESGYAVISGKLVEAGYIADPGTTDTIVFPFTFSTPPVVLLYLHRETDSGTATTIRVEGTPAADQAEIAMFGGIAAGVHWVAMEAGSYVHGRFRWTAGTASGLGSAATTFTFPQAFDSEPGVLLTVHDTNGSGATWARLEGVTTSDFTVQGSSSAELVHWIAFTEDK